MFCPFRSSRTRPAAFRVLRWWLMDGLEMSKYSAISPADVYPILPEEVPIHWNVYGEADNWAGKASTLFLALLPMLSRPIRFLRSRDF